MFTSATSVSEPFRGAWIDGLGGQQIAHVRARLRDPQQPGPVVHEVVDRVDVEAGPQQVEHDAGLEVARARAHREARGRGKAHRGLDAATVVNRGEARTRAKVREDHAPSGLGRRDASELFEQERVGEPMEPVPAHGLLRVVPRDRQQLREAREVGEERGVEAHHLSEIGPPAADLLDDAELGWQVVGIERDQRLQLGQEPRRHAAGAIMNAARRTTRTSGSTSRRSG
jgi:hypothetical protein